MFKSRLLTGVALAALCLPAAALSPALPFAATAAQAQTANVSFQLFFDQLQPHGVWVRHARYQYVFCPTGIDANWRPYTHGRWLYLDGRGWYFASDEPFAWATYHYGRWFPDRNLGWCWVPGTKWAPAWVSWRRSDSVVGWAPLPPEQDGFVVSVEVRKRDLPAGYWVYVPTERFVEPDLAVSVVIGSNEPEYYAQTEFLGPVVIEGDVVVNNVIDVTYIEQTINQQVIVYQPQEAASPAEQSVAVEAQAIAVFDQDVAEPEAEAAPPEAVEEEQAVETIEAEGGTAGTTAEIAAEAEAEGEQPAGDAAAPSEDEQPAAPADATETAPSDANQTEEAPAEDAAAEPAAPDAEAQPSDQPAEASEPAAPADEQPAEATEAEGQPAAEPPCPPETMVDGQFPVTEPEQPAQEAPAQEEQPAAPAAEEEPAAPAEEAAPAPEPEAAAPAEEAAPAPAEEAAPTEEPAPEAAPAPEGQAQDELPCPPEARVDGKCPPVQQ